MQVGLKFQCTMPGRRVTAFAFCIGSTAVYLCVVYAALMITGDDTRTGGNTCFVQVRDIYTFGRNV